MTGAPDALISEFLAALGPVETPLGLAVSGGGDSVAMLLAATGAGLAVEAVTVDHGLRPEAAAEADWVARLCARHGVRHEVRCWTGWDGSGNLQDHARRARLALIADWARARGIGTVALAHTRDDLAETFLMRLARRAGVDGLAAMQVRREHLGVTWLRPLLGIGRDELRDWLTAQGQDWIDDPSNVAARFERVRARRALAALKPLGLGVGVLADVAQQLSEARAALEAQTAEAARPLCRIDAMDVLIAREGFLALPVEIRRRLLVAALAWVAPTDYGPRAAPVQTLLRGIAAGRGGTLAGCRVLTGPKAIRFTRELRALSGKVAAPGAEWDRRWIVEGPAHAGNEVRALGPEGLAACPDWRARGLPRAALLVSPAVWKGAALVAAPLARADRGWTARPARDSEAFVLSILSH